VYYYILDPHNLSLQKFEKIQIELQGLLAEFNVNGEVGRVTALRNIPDLIETASQRGANTLIACGSDDTFNLMLAQLRGRDFTVGFIPLDETSYLGKILGLDSLHTAVKTIAARRIEKIDLAKMGSTYFIGSAEFGITGHDIKNVSLWNSFTTLAGKIMEYQIRIDNSYTITAQSVGGAVVNTRMTSASTQALANPTDGYLDLLLMDALPKSTILRHKQDIIDTMLENTPRSSVIKCRRIEFIEPRGLGLSIAGKVMTKFPEIIEIIPRRLKMIVGKNRTF
jgi:diacylglycerol kinase family enzyme